MKSIPADLEFGCIIKPEQTQFRFFCPEAASVYCHLFDDYDEVSIKMDMIMSDTGVWELIVPKDLTGKWYGYSVLFPKKKLPNSPYSDVIFADPYSKHVTVKNTYKQQALSFIFRQDFDWDDDEFNTPKDHRELIIYETHIKDLVALTGSKENGVYNQFSAIDHNGGINYLKSLGVNAVEFLPLHKFPPVEPPYFRETEEGFLNTWNPYETNYWGYMTSFFFAPETSFASDAQTKPDTVNGLCIASVNELKSLVKKLHKNDITVIMDVVFNHSSIFDMNPICHLMPIHYLRHDEKERLLNRSGTGNELKTESPVVRKLIIDSLLYWMKEYHIDGFRFDLAGLIDSETWDIIKEETSKVNPNVILIAEPWGGEYSPHRFSDHDWSSWNDKFRNGIKGVEPSQEKGFIFSTWANGTTRQELENFFRGTLRNHDGGLFHSSQHSVNYLESHDGYTLGDFIRLVYRPELALESHSRNQVVQLTTIEHQTAMLAAFCLFVSQGILMLNAGQEYGRSKWVQPVNGKDEFACKPDHNSYEKDNETNWLNLKDIDQNRPLFNYYKGLIEIRKASPALHSAMDDKIHFYNYSDPLHVCFHINSEDTDDLFDYFVALNAHDEYESSFHLPYGSWELIADHQYASLKTLDIRSGEQVLQPKCTMLFRKLRH